MQSSRKQGFGNWRDVEVSVDRRRGRTQLGLASARAQGRLGGRPRAMSDAKIKQARRMCDGGMSLADIRDVVGVSRSTLYRYLK